jgi:hypothetical protein
MDIKHASNTDSCWRKIIYSTGRTPQAVYYPVRDSPFPDGYSGLLRLLAISPNV